MLSAKWRPFCLGLNVLKCHPKECQIGGVIYKKGLLPYFTAVIEFWFYLRICIYPSQYTLKSSSSGGIDTWWAKTSNEFLLNGACKFEVGWFCGV